MIKYLVQARLHIHTLLLIILVPFLVWNTVLLLDITEDNEIVRHSYAINITHVIIEATELQTSTNTDEEYLQYLDDIQINCMALAIYGEARGESAEGMAAVAYVVMNRAMSIGKRFPDDPCDVVIQSYQFESVKDSLKNMVLSAKYGDYRFPYMDNAWISRKIRRIARDVYYFQIPDPTNYATHFWSPKLQSALGRKEPAWSTIYPIVARVGDHIYHE